MLTYGLLGIEVSLEWLRRCDLKFLYELYVFNFDRLFLRTVFLLLSTLLAIDWMLG